MADASRAELTTAIAVVDSQIRGLEALLKFPLLTPDTATAILSAMEIRTRRRELIEAAIEALDSVRATQSALERDGYPELGSIPVLAAIEEEVQQDLKDLEAAVTAFEGDLVQIAGDPASITFADQPLPQP